MSSQNARLKMVSTAIDLFHVQGVNATSVDQVLERSGTGKGQFSHYFKTKEGLIHAALIYLSEEIQAARVPTVYQVSSWKQMDGWFTAFIDFQRSVGFERSCPIGTIGTDVSSKQPALRKEIVFFLDWSREELASFFTARKAAGELVPSARPRELADLCITVMQGGMLLTKLRRDPDVFESAARQVKSYIKSLRKCAPARARISSL